jgi:hypothetical protein
MKHLLGWLLDLFKQKSENQPLDNRWYSGCDLCGKHSPGIESVHVFPPALTFYFCNKCCKNIAACDRLIADVSSRALYKSRKKSQSI